MEVDEVCRSADACAGAGVEGCDLENVVRGTVEVGQGVVCLEGLEFRMLVR